MKDSKKIRTITFNILVILTLLFVYFFFFPKKSYVKDKVDNLDPLVNDKFKENINTMKIASDEYFSINENKTVTLQELIDQDLVIDLNDSKGEACSTTSYVEKTDEMIKIHLECKDKSGDRFISLKDGKFLCVYQYEKKLESGYTEWSNWSEWTTNQIEANELINVETEIRKESDGKTTVPETKEETIDAYARTEKIYTETIDANQQTYNKNGKTYVSFTCPANTSNKEYVKENTKCKVYTVRVTSYSCPEGYNLSGSTCHRTISSNQEIDKFKDVTYYRYQTREKTNEKIDIKWSTKDDQNLLNDSYNMVGKISCEF